MKARRVVGAVKRSAWRMLAARHLGVAHQAGQDGQARRVGARPASGRSAFERRSQIAPEPARQPSGAGSAAIELVEAAGRTVDDQEWRSLPPSISGAGGMGYGPASDSSGHVKATACPAVAPSTTFQGMP